MWKCRVTIKNQMSFLWLWDRGNEITGGTFEGVQGKFEKSSSMVGRVVCWGTSGKSCLTDKKGCKEEMLPALLLLDVNPPTWMTYLDWRRPSCNAENARAAMERTWVCKGILGHWDWEPRSWSIQDFLLHGNNKWLHCYTTWVGAFPYFQPKASQWTQIWNTLASS